MAGSGNYLKWHSEALVKDVGIKQTCSVTGKSKATLGRYYSYNLEHAGRYMPINPVVRFEKVAGFPQVTMAFSELCGNTISSDDRRRTVSSKWFFKRQIIAFSQSFTMLMSVQVQIRWCDYSEREKAPLAETSSVASSAY